MKKLTALFITTIFLTLTTAYAADETQCRNEVVAAYTSLGESINANDFSNRTFTELEISYQEFNLLSSQEQDEIYMQVKPLEVMIEETIGKLNRYINRYAGTFYEMFMLDEIDEWRTHRDALRKCQD